MKCPYCGGETIVVNSRSGEDEVIRERKCKECGMNFYTCETDMDFEEGHELMRRYEYEKKKAKLFKMNLNS